MLSSAQGEIHKWMLALNAFIQKHQPGGKLQSVGEFPAVRDAALRATIIAEETSETCEALTGVPWECRPRVFPAPDPPKPPDLVEVADGLADILVVALGTAVACGINLTPVFEAVMATNWEKFAEGATMREDGKFVKPPNWQPPDVAGLLRAQGWDGKS